MRILVTGGAGYIGSVMTDVLIDGGHHVVVIDNLQRGHRDAVRSEAVFVEADLQDREAVASVLKTERIDAVIHMAGDALVGESMQNPGKYYRTNVIAGLTLLEAMEQSAVRTIVFSSTCAIYGVPDKVPIDENTPTRPVNPYGDSKLTFEHVLGWYHRAHGFRVAALRYFNAAGASERFGERHEPETHLIPILLEVASGRRDAIQLFGTDYDTADGTCLRDYVHVRDIAEAHVLCLAQLDTIGAEVFNLGNGTGYTNRQVIDAVQRVTGRQIAVVPAPRRAGDPARLVASSDRIRQIVGWTPALPRLEPMIESAWRWARVNA